MRAGGFVFDYRPDTLRNLCLVLSRRVACADQPRGRGAGERATTLLILDLCLKSRHVPVFLDPSLLAAPCVCSPRVHAALPYRARASFKQSSIV